LKADDAKRLKDLVRGERDFDGDRVRKLLDPARQRAAVNHVVVVMGLSDRFAGR